MKKFIFIVLFFVGLNYLGIYVEDNNVYNHIENNFQSINIPKMPNIPIKLKPHPHIYYTNTYISDEDYYKMVEEAQRRDMEVYSGAYAAEYHYRFDKK